MNAFQAYSSASCLDRFISSLSLHYLMNLLITSPDESCRNIYFNGHSYHVNVAQDVQQIGDEMMLFNSLILVLVVNKLVSK